MFKALADQTRREFLDLLFERDGQSLTELWSHLDMTRFGAMSHLRVLEEANLVVSRKEGRSRRYYLNAVPVQEIHARWINKYTEPFVTSLIALKDQLEKP